MGQRNHEISPVVKTKSKWFKRELGRFVEDGAQHLNRRQLRLRTHLLRTVLCRTSNNFAQVPLSDTQHEILQVIYLYSAVRKTDYNYFLTIFNT